MTQRRRAALIWFAVLAALAAARVSQAHHSYEFNYDGAKLLTMAGTVKLFAIENPHSRIVIETRDAKGAVETWTVESIPASRAAQMNHPLQSVKLKPGDEVTVMGWPTKDGSKRIGGHRLILPDQREIMLRPAINLPIKRV